MAQLYYSDGVSAVVPSGTQGSQIYGQIARLADGGYVITWSDWQSNRIAAQIYDAQGNTVGPVLTVGTEGYFMLSSTVIGLSDGGFMVAWSFGSLGYPYDFTYNIAARRFDADGNPMSGQFTVNTTIPLDQNQPIMTELSNGDIVVAWTTRTAYPTATAALFFQRYASTGEMLGQETRIDNGSLSGLGANYDFVKGCKITALDGGGFVITWSTHGQDGDGVGIAARAYAADGTATGPEFQVNAVGHDEQFLSSVTGLDDGGYVIAWAAAAEWNFGANGTALYAQRFAADGSRLGVEIEVTGPGTGLHYAVELVTLSDGSFVAAWSAQEGDVGSLLAQRFAADGQKLGGVIRIAAGSTWGVDLAALDNGGFAVTWNHYSEATGVIVQERHFTVTGGADKDLLIYGDSGGEVLVGDSGDDHIFGGTSNDVITGVDGGDVLSGGAGNDAIDGGAGDDLVLGGAGDDSLSGGSGNDTLSYADASAGVTVSLAMGVYSDGTGADMVDGFEHLIGSKYNDRLSAEGGSAGNMLNGGAGADTLTGGLGDDTYVIDSSDDKVNELHHSGMDTIYSTVSYSLFGRAIETFVMQYAAGDLAVTGNSLNNTLIGNDGNNWFDGGGGADVMKGDIGNDTYYVDHIQDNVVELHGGGTDTVYSSVNYSLFGRAVENYVMLGDANLSVTGNSLNNRLTGNAGNNWFDGGTGGDKMIGGLGNDTYYVDNFYDDVTELHLEGTDTVFSSVTYSLFGRAVEIMTLTGSAHINATGNSIANTLTGNSGNNRLDGGVGNDTLTGGNGADVFVFMSGTWKDTVTDFSATQNDMIDINAYTHGVDNSTLVVQSGVNVVISLGGGNAVTVLNAARADVLSHMVW